MADLKFSSEEDDLLITLIEENKTLYDPDSESYKDVSVRDNIWRTIAKYLNKTDEECRKRWKHIRDSYNRYKRKRKSGLVLRYKNSKYEFYKRLAFLEKVPLEDLDGHVIDNSDSDNISSPCVYLPVGPSVSDQQADDDNEREIEDVKPLRCPLRSPLSPLVPPARHKKLKLDEFLEVSIQRDDNRHFMSDLSDVNMDERDDDDLTFGNHVKTVLKKLSPRLKILAKKEIFDTLTKYETLNLDGKERRS